MAQSARPGEMRTKVHFKAVTRVQNTNGFYTETETDVFGEAVWCKCVYAHGDEVFDAERIDISERATLTMWYSANVNRRQRVYIESDPEPYEIVSINDVLGRRRYLEIKIRREVKA